MPRFLAKFCLPCPKYRYPRYIQIIDLIPAHPVGPGLDHIPQRLQAGTIPRSLVWNVRTEKALCRKLLWDMFQDKMGNKTQGNPLGGQRRKKDLKNGNHGYTQASPMRTKFQILRGIFWIFFLGYLPGLYASYLGRSWESP